MLSGQDRWIWPFELTEKIGEGGMGVVYRARYVVNDRPVAVKLLPPDVTDETLLGRFEREVEILKTLRHPNIVLCFGGVCENKRRFYAMELVEGGTLDDLLRKRGRLPWELVVEYARQMCAALAYAHERGVIHRDIKPGNFLIKGDGQIKLSDFGLATLIAGRKITAAGRTAGTYEYMAPEQITGKELSPKTDLYALGVVIYELITGKPPFEGATPAEVLHAHLKAPVPRVAARMPDCPSSLDALVAALMAKAPEDRPDGAAAVAEMLRAISPSIRVDGGAPAIGVSNRPTPAAKRAPPAEPAAARSASGGHRLPWWAPAAAVCVLGLAVTWTATQQRRLAVLARAEAAWIESFRQGDFAERLLAARALGGLSADSDAAYSALVDGLTDANPPFREAAVKGLGESGDRGRSLIPTLMKTAKVDENAAVRSAAVQAVETLKAAPKRSSSSSWILLATLFVSGGVAAWSWRRAAKRPASVASDA